MLNPGGQRPVFGSGTQCGSSGKNVQLLSGPFGCVVGTRVGTNGGAAVCAEEEVLFSSFGGGGQDGSSGVAVQSTTGGVASAGTFDVPIDGGCPPDGGAVPPPDGGAVPPPDGGAVPPPDGGAVPALDDAADADELFFASTGKKSILGKIPIVTIEDKRMKQIIRAVAVLFMYNTSNGVIYMYPCDSHHF
jgi:hypothetical protein